MTLETFWSMFGQFFSIWTQWVTKTSPRGRHIEIRTAQGFQMEVILATKSHPKSIKYRLWDRYGYCIDFLFEIGRFLLSKSMTFWPSSRASSRFQAILIYVDFLIGNWSKMSSKWLSKPSKIRPGSDPEPYQKIDDFLKRVGEEVARFGTIPREWILPRKGGDLGG